MACVTPDKTVSFPLILSFGVLVYYMYPSSSRFCAFSLSQAGRTQPKSAQPDLSVSLSLLPRHFNKILIPPTWKLLDCVSPSSSKKSTSRPPCLSCSIQRRSEATSQRVGPVGPVEEPADRASRAHLPSGPPATLPSWEASISHFPISPFPTAKGSRLNFSCPGRAKLSSLDTLDDGLPSVESIPATRTLTPSTRRGENRQTPNLPATRPQPVEPRQHFAAGLFCPTKADIPSRSNPKFRAPRLRVWHWCRASEASHPTNQTI
jgi:hypothetical protein